MVLVETEQARRELIVTKDAKKIIYNLIIVLKNTNIITSLVFRFIFAVRDQSLGFQCLPSGLLGLRV